MHNQKRHCCFYSSQLYFGKSLASLLLLFLFTPKILYAQIYYVDAILGNDSNDGISEATSWRTISKVNITGFLPGDSILFKRGEMWREQLVVPSSGTAGDPLTIAAYSTGEKPVINPSIIVTSWNVYSGNIYVADVNPGVGQVFVDGNYYNLASYPNDGYLIIDENSSTKSYLIDNDLNLSSEDAIGADIYIRADRWLIEKRNVSGYLAASHQIQWSPDISYAARQNYGYYLAKKLWMLDMPKEWFYDGTAKKLYIWLENGDSPDSHTVEAAIYSYGISATDRNYLTIRDISIKNAKLNSINIVQGTGITIENVEVYNSGQKGIFFNTVNDSAIKNSSISDSLNEGIFIGFGASNNIGLLDNTVKNSGNVGIKPKGSLAGLCVAGTSNRNVTVRNNNILNSGYSGIAFSGINNIVQNNFVDNSCLVLDDCAGIYTFAWAGSDPGVNGQIIGNIITNSIGNPSGTPHAYTIAEGVYLDSVSHNTTVSNNTVTNTDDGIYLHNSYNNTISHNHVYNSRRIGFRIIEDALPGTPAGFIHDNIVETNYFLSVSTKNASAEYIGTLGSVNFGQYNNNYYSRLYYGYPVSQTVSAARTNYLLPQWRTDTSQDLNSKDIGDYYKVNPYKVNSTVGINLIINGAFDSDISNWSKWPAATVTVAWSDNCTFSSGGCSQVSTTETSSAPLLISNNFYVERDKNYLVEFDAVSASNASQLTFSVKRSVSPWDSLGIYKTIATKTTPGHYSFVFKVNDTVSNARLDFELKPNILYSLDNISIKEADVTYNNSADDTAIHYNATQNSSVVNLGTQKFCDLDNNVVEGSFSLAPYTSKILLACLNNNDGKCNNRESHATAPNDCVPGEYGELAVSPAAPKGLRLR